MGKTRNKSVSLGAWVCRKKKGKGEGNKLLGRGADRGIGTSVLWFQQGCNLSIEESWESWTNHEVWKSRAFLWLLTVKVDPRQADFPQLTSLSNSAGIEFFWLWIIYLFWLFVSYLNFLSSPGEGSSERLWNPIQLLAELMIPTRIVTIQALAINFTQLTHLANYSEQN